MSSKLSVGRPYEKISSSTTLGVRPMSRVSYSPCSPAPCSAYRRRSFWPTAVCTGHYMHARASAADYAEAGACHKGLFKQHSMSNNT